jgi:murein DD-endopeptidase MepM/ murein hydrolase activator NlpD
MSAARSAAAFQPSVLIVDPEKPRQGDIVRITINMPISAKGGTMTLDGKTYPAFVTGGLLNAFLGVDLDTKPGSHDLAFEFTGAMPQPGREPDTKGAVKIEIGAREFATEGLDVDTKYTELDAATQKRADAEAAELEKLWSVITPERLWGKSFLRPTIGELGSPFGLRRVFNGEPKSPHAGLDLEAEAGAEIYASNTGRVALARDLFFTGNTIVIDHGMGLYTIYAHLQRMDVKEGAAVERAQLIGLVGATGRATGPHLHWGVRLGGARVDPTLLPGLVL